MVGTTFSTTLQTLRKNRGVTQEQLAIHLGVSPQAVSKWENGSYPDGDLLPQIADYFEVSIDYLYGRAKDNVSIEQQIVDAIKKGHENDDKPEGKEAKEHGAHAEQMLRYLWAMHIGHWYESTYYYDRSVSDRKETMVSAITDQEGFSYMRLNSNLEYYSLMKEPKEGFASFFQVTDELVELFELLSDRDNLKVLFFLLSLQSGECIGASTIAKRLGLQKEKVEVMLQFLCKGYSGNQMLMKVNLVDENDKKETVYVLNSVTATSVLMILAGADAMLHVPNSYMLQIGRREEGWFERDKLDFLQKPGKK